MKFYDDTLGDMIEDEFGVPPEAMEEIYGFSNPYDDDDDFGYCESEAKYRELEEKLEQGYDEMYFDEVVGKILEVIRDAYAVYPTISMLRTIEDVVNTIRKSGHRLSRMAPPATDANPDEPEGLMRTADVPVMEDEDNDVPF